MSLESKIESLANAIEAQAAAIQSLVDTSELILQALAQAAESEIDQEYNEEHQYLDG